MLSVKIIFTETIFFHESASCTLARSRLPRGFLISPGELRIRRASCRRCTARVEGNISGEPWKAPPPRPGNARETERLGVPQNYTHPALNDVLLGLYPSELYWPMKGNDSPRESQLQLARGK